ncbi:GGDEF domain-containing protein [uncultured Deefgea sp.]|uniref:GGDEF domain-containing protein n=1 Tax=uncultured Deefgea sp. TaxID=1304914 RepID=UPI002591B967|nr:GGDEF domain-containing protein [uncultured Deefgea sp.]
MPQQLARLLRRMMVALMLLTVLLLMWQHWGMTRVIRFDAENNAGIFFPIDDRPLGGKSLATVTRESDAMVLSCALDGQAYAWPFCEASVRIATAPKGIDLSGLNEMHLDLGLSSPKGRKIRIYLRNYEPEFSTLDDPLSLKVNEVEIDVPENGQLTIPLRYFRVASWWLIQKNIPFMHSDMKLNNVSHLEIITPNAVVTGDYQISMNAIEFRGKWINLTQLLAGIVVVWLLFGMVWLILELVIYRQQVYAKRLQMAELKNINRALEIQAENLSYQVRFDSLTGALNREGLRDFLLQRWQGDRLSEAGMSLLFVDLDYFKKINDQFGHAVGDQVLQLFSQILKSEIRQSDALVRWGGEEFLIVCPYTPLDAAARLADKLRLAIEQADWPNGIALTCSCGVATRNPAEGFSALIERADAALYRAKAAGRNRVEVG